MSYNSKTIDLILKADQNGKQFTTFQQFFKSNNPPPLLFEKNITPKNTKIQRSFSNKTQDSIKETKRKSLSQLKYPEYRMLKIYARVKPGECTLNFDKQSILIDSNTYSFDRVFDQGSTQDEVFQLVAMQTSKDLLDSINGCIIAYGQTGSGKTYTMFGEQQNQGIVLKTFAYLFEKHVSQMQVSVLEVYKDHIYDLISGIQDLKLKEDQQLGFYVDGLKKIKVDKIENCIELLSIAEENRHVAETKLNALSSRSHLILTIYLGKSKLYLVDLAGSEKVNKTGAVGETLQEAKKINYSLSCLGHVIQCLSQGQDHVPYRDSKLTKLLQDSLQTDCRTSIIVTISPEQRNQEETVSSLKFAQRARFIKKEIRIATQKKTYKDLELEVSQLKQELMETKQRMSQTSSVSQFQCRYITDSELPCTESLRLTYRSMNTENKENMLPNLNDQAHIAGVELEGKINQIILELQSLSKESNLDNIKKRGLKINDLIIDMKQQYKILNNTHNMNHTSITLQQQFIDLQVEQNKQLQKITELIQTMDSSKPSFHIAINNMIKNLQNQQKQNLETLQNQLDKMHTNMKKTNITVQDHNTNHLALKLVASPNRQQQLKRSQSKNSVQMNPSVKYLRNNQKK